MPYYAIDGIRPVVHPDSYVHPTAVVIGDVIIGAGCYVGLMRYCAATLDA